MAMTYLARSILCFFPLLAIVEAVLKNVTVDDSLPDPLTGQLITYLPADRWNVGVECSDCTAVLDRQFMYDKTWHDGTYSADASGPLNAAFKFNGTAIYAFCAISLSNTELSGYSNMTFYIDAELVGRFERIPPGVQGSYQYNVSVYSTTSLPPESMNLYFKTVSLDILGITH
ncbi:hypothetical protein BDQ17DRAFT_949096 [Cyathus striatus]|nr:hypothetical protein BDQ17DRAFT_949096 [Cyathus striatus]